MAVQQGRSERRGESYSVPYVEPLRDARTSLAAFFRILLEQTVLCRFRTNLGPSKVGLPIGRGKSAVMERDDAHALVLLFDRLELRDAVFGVHGPLERIDYQQVGRSGGFDHPHEGGGTAGIGAGSFPLAD